MSSLKALFVASVLSGAVGVAVASSDDDLAVVRRAVSAEKPSASVAARAHVAPAHESTRAQTASADDDGPPARTGRAFGAGREPQWLKVRVTEKGLKRTRVSINLPFAFVKGMADDDGRFPIDWKCRKNGKSCSLDVAEILRTLERGQELVQVEDEDSTVRIWVE